MFKNKKFLTIGFVVVAVVAALGFVCDNLFADVIANLIGGEMDVLSAFAFVGATAEATAVGTVKPVMGVDSKTGEIEKPEVNKPSFSKKLTKVFPSKFPLDTIARELPKGKTNSDEYKYASVVSRALGCVIESQTTKTTAPALAEIKVVSTHMLSIDSNLMVPNYNAGVEAEPSKVEGVALSPLILHVVGIDRAANKITVYPVNHTVVPAMTGGTFLARVGVAKDQLSAMSEDPISMPTYDSNYCQINMTTISEAFFQKIQEKETEWSMADMQDCALYDFRGQSEMAMLFGAKKFFLDPVTSKPKYLMDGVIRKVGNPEYLTGGAVTEKLLNAALAKIFDGNNGSEARLMFYGSDFGLSLAENAAFAKQIEAGKTKVKFGITWNEIETNHGVVLAKKHDAFKQVGFGRAALVIDPANFRRIEQRPLTVYDLDREAAGISRTQDRRIDESFTIEVTNPDTHGLITF